MSKIEIGTIVKLKSGGPTMTVTRVIGESDDMLQRQADELLRTRGHSNGSFVCQWFDNAELKENVFPPHAVEEFDPGALGGF